ncbi:mechanosensitive ion channel family protein [Halogeometricum borinquense]|uniref:Mechanosensitive ion channel family protein n=2 Tax=Halogeometricum borinquense TaxID=60847 RepID=A0A6C0UHC1_9EURY|nr:mechanosensitive ion channel family protein [Halogeometricum borinquense]QIB74882.1 mechanosensitive ion channel family protein [Halogeometricum borinquense]QIQ76119.1 mechanosensitive ion channel family protein [Halogeometricum borinquense]
MALTPILLQGGVSALSELAEAVPSFTGRTLITGAVIFFVTALLAKSDELHDYDLPGIPSALWSLLVSLTTMTLATAAAAVIVGVWGQAEAVASVFEGYDLGYDSFVKLGLSVLLVVGAYTMTGLVRRLVDEVTAARPAVSQHQREIAFRIAQVFLYAFTIAIVLAIWEVNLSGILVGAGFLGIVVGMAARQTLGALLAGFVLMFSRPFEIGDWIEVGDHEGIVTDITIVNTRIQTFDGEYVMVPNDVVSSESLINRSRKGRLRIEVEVGVDYDADPERAAELALEAVEELDDPLNVPTPQVVLKQFADSAIILGIRVWIDRPSARRKWRTQTAVIAAVKDAFESADIKIPFPQRELMARQEADGFVVAGDGRESEHRRQTEPTPDGGSDDA